MRLMAVRGNDREFQAFGKQLIERIRFYIRAYHGRLTRPQNTRHHLDSVAGSEYFFESRDELVKKVTKLRQVTKENESSLPILKQAVDEANRN